MFSWFKKKQQPQTVPKVNLNSLPALNEWAQFFQGNGLTVSSRWVGGVPGTESETIYLKSFPEVPLLERAVFADWICVADNGIYLRQLPPDAEAGSTLLFIDFDTTTATSLKTGILAPYWSDGYHNGARAIFFKGNTEAEVFEL